MKKNILIIFILSIVTSHAWATQIYVNGTPPNTYPTPWVNSTNNTNTQPAQPIYNNPAPPANTLFQPQTNNNQPIQNSAATPNIVVAQNAVTQTLLNVPNVMSSNNTVTVLAYDDSHKNAWMNSCVTGVRDQRVSAYAQEFCECGWQRISGGSLPPQLLLSQAPNDIKQRQVILAAISQFCVVQIKASHHLG